MGLMHHHRRVRALRDLAAAPVAAPPEAVAVSPLALSVEVNAGSDASSASRSVAESIAAQQQKKAPQRH